MCCESFLPCGTSFKYELFSMSLSNYIKERSLGKQLFVFSLFLEQPLLICFPSHVLDCSSQNSQASWPGGHQKSDPEYYQSLVKK